jgi:hypothetical protein
MASKQNPRHLLLTGDIADFQSQPYHFQTKISLVAHALVNVPPLGVHVKHLEICVHQIVNVE